MAVAELAAQRLQITCESRDVGSAEQAQLMRPALRAGGAITGWVLFEHHVEIGAAKAKRGRAAATRMLRMRQPLARPPAQLCRRLRIGERVDRLVDAGMGRQQPAVERKGTRGPAGPNPR